MAVLVIRWLASPASLDASTSTFLSPDKSAFLIPVDVGVNVLVCCSIKTDINRLFLLCDGTCFGNRMMRSARRASINSQIHSQPWHDARLWQRWWRRREGGKNYSWFVLFESVPFYHSSAAIVCGRCLAILVQASVLTRFAACGATGAC